MRNVSGVVNSGDVRRAESILRLATTPERAATIAGDLAERGVRFRRSVLSTAISLAGRDVLHRPGRLAGLAVAVIFVQILLREMLLWTVPFLLFQVVPDPGVSGLQVSRAVLFFALQILLGRTVARRFAQYSLAVCFAVSACSVILTIMSGHPLFYSVFYLPAYCWQVPFAAGMFFVRSSSRESLNLSA